jgi:hypothetical protein
MADRHVKFGMAIDRKHTLGSQLSVNGLSDLWINCSAFRYNSRLNVKEMVIFVLSVQRHLNVSIVTALGCSIPSTICCSNP